MEEVLRIVDKSKALGCNFKIEQFNTEDNKNIVVYKYNELQRYKARLQEARQSVRVLEELVKDKEEEFKLIEPLIDLTFHSTEKEWKSTEIEGAVINKTDYRNTNI